MSDSKNVLVHAHWGITEAWYRPIRPFLEYLIRSTPTRGDETLTFLDADDKPDHDAAQRCAVTLRERILAGVADSYIHVDVQGHHVRVWVGASATRNAKRPKSADELAREDELLFPPRPVGCVVTSRATRTPEQIRERNLKYRTIIADEAFIAGWREYNAKYGNHPESAQDAPLPPSIDPTKPSS